MTIWNRPITNPAAHRQRGKTVTVRRKEGRKKSRSRPWRRVTIISDRGCDCSVDGPADAAGAIVDGRTIPKAEANGLDARKFLGDNNSLSFFSKLRDLILTGPTGTNLNDVVVIVALNAKR